MSLTHLSKLKLICSYANHFDGNPVTSQFIYSQLDEPYLSDNFDYELKAALEYLVDREFFELLIPPITLIINKDSITEKVKEFVFLDNQRVPYLIKLACECIWHLPPNSLRQCQAPKCSNLFASTHKCKAYCQKVCRNRAMNYRHREKCRKLRVIK